MRFGLKVTDRATPYIIQRIKDDMEEMRMRLVTAGGFLFEKMHDALMPSPNYSLKQLRAMGHPYARRRWKEAGSGIFKAPWGQIPEATPPAMPGIHDPYWMVNRQTSQLIHDLQIAGPEVTPPFLVSKGAVTSIPQLMEIRVGIPDGAPSSRYAKHVIYGTRTMAPRNFIGKSLIQNQDIIRGMLLGKR